MSANFDLLPSRDGCISSQLWEYTNLKPKTVYSNQFWMFFTFTLFCSHIQQNTRSRGSLTKIKSWKLYFMITSIMLKIIDYKNKRYHDQFLVDDFIWINKTTDQVIIMRILSGDIHKIKEWRYNRFCIKQKKWCEWPIICWSWNLALVMGVLLT